MGLIGKRERVGGLISILAFFLAMTAILGPETPRFPSFPLMEAPEGFSLEEESMETPPTSPSSPLKTPFDLLARDRFAESFPPASEQWSRNEGWGRNEEKPLNRDLTSLTDFRSFCLAVAFADRSGVPRFRPFPPQKSLHSLFSIWII